MNFDQMLRTKTHEEIWQRYCNFLDMNLDQFMEIQNQLLMEQIDLYANCELGQSIMKGQKPRDPDEFRRIVPLTDYEDYADYLLPKNAKVLPAEPVVWISGGPVDLEQQLLVCVLACQPHPEAQVAGRADGHQVVHDAAAGGLCSVGGVEAHSSTQLQLGPWLHGTDQSAHGGFGVLILHDAGTGPLGEDPRPREAGDH